MTLVWTSGRPLGIPDRHNEDLFVGVRVEGFLSSVSVRLVAIVKLWPPRQRVGGWNA